MLATANSTLEAALIAQTSHRLGRRLTSAEIGVFLAHMISAQITSADVTRLLPFLLRLALKASPYAPNVDALLADHVIALRAWASPRLLQVIQTLATCREMGLPVPIIASCQKYLPKARVTQIALTRRYFGIVPLIVVGDSKTIEESFTESVLVLPVNDSYEALPIKIFETFGLLSALGADHGVLKIDDDLEVLGTTPIDLAHLQNLFGTADYIGTALASPHHDRSWHFGKCLSPMPVVYGKPFRAAWARGALYYVSGRALHALSRHFLRFPGCLDGEIYEDKAVGDVLNEMGFALLNHPLETELGLSTAAPERLLRPAKRVFGQLSATDGS